MPTTRIRAVTAILTSKDRIEKLSREWFIGVTSPILQRPRKYLFASRPSSPAWERPMIAWSRPMIVHAKRPATATRVHLRVRTTFDCLQTNEVFEVAEVSDDDYLSFVFAKRLDLNVGVSQELPIGIVGTGFVRDGLQIEPAHVLHLL